MVPPRFIPVVLKQVLRHRTRSVLTVLGVAVAMFLFCTVRALQAGAESVTAARAGDTRLVVYRKDRYCPFTSRMPESYAPRIAQIPGVASVVPMKISVSNCRTSLDVVIFRGVPEKEFLDEYGPRLEVLAGSLETWRSRSDAALLGETLARRRGLRTGDRFDAAGVTVYVAGIIRSDDPEHQNVAYTHLGFLQRATERGRLGIVTQFNVRVDEPSRMEAVAAAIDAEFVADPEPTQTRSEKAFIARAAGDVLEIVRFTRYLGWGCLAAVLALVANAIVLAVQQRVREHAILQTLGYRPDLIGRLIVLESAALSVAGAAAGCLPAYALLRWGQFSLAVEGLSIPIETAPAVYVQALGLAVVVGVLAGLAPAWRAARAEIVECFRAV